MLRTAREVTGAGVLIITHDMGVVADVADRVIVMRQGHVEETQDVDALFARPSGPVVLLSPGRFEPFFRLSTPPPTTTNVPTHPSSPVYSTMHHGCGG